MMISKFGRIARSFCLEYRRVISFGLVLSGLVVLSYWLSRYIPADFYEQQMVPMFYAATFIATSWASFALLKHNEGIRARKILGYVFLFWTLLEIMVIIFNFAVENSLIEPHSMQTRTFTIVMGNICAWMLLIYPTEALRPGWLTLWKAIALLLPAIALALLYYLTPFDSRILIALYPLIVFVTILRNIREYRKWCEDNFASLDDVDMHWIWQYLLMIVVISVSYYYLCFSTHPTRTFTQMWLLLFLIIHTTDNVLFRHDLWTMVHDADHPLSEEPEPSDPVIKEEQYRKNLDEYMEKEKPYLNKDFRLTDLRFVVPLNRTYMSQFINSVYGCNFYQYVTSYRLREAKRLMTTHPDMKLQEVADLTGFSSPTVFSRTFVRAEGVTPTEWVETLKSANPEQSDQSEQSEQSEQPSEPNQ